MKSVPPGFWLLAEPTNIRPNTLQIEPLYVAAYALGISLFVYARIRGSYYVKSKEKSFLRIRVNLKFCETFEGFPRRMFKAVITNIHGVDDAARCG
jgi:hypothetical protein